VRRPGGGARRGRKRADEDGETAEDEAASRKQRVRVMVAVGAAIHLLALGLLAGGLYWMFWRSPSEDRAEGPVATEAGRLPDSPHSVVPPPPEGRANPLPPPDTGGKPALPPNGGSPAKPPIVPVQATRRLKDAMPFFDFAVAEGRALVTLENPERLRVELPNRSVIVGFNASGTAIDRFALSDDGRRLLVAYTDGTLRLWEFGKPNPVQTFGRHVAPIACVALSSDGRLALSAGGKPDGTDSAIRVWDLEGGKELRRLQGHQGKVERVAFAPDGKRAVSVGDDFDVRVWDVDAGRELFRLDQLKPAMPLCAAFAPDGNRLLVAGRDGVLTLWDAVTGQEVRRFPRQAGYGWVWDVAFTPDGRRAVAASGPSPEGTQGAVHLWNLERGQVEHVYSFHRSAVRRVIVVDEGRAFYSSGDDGQLWRVALAPPRDGSRPPEPVVSKPAKPAPDKPPPPPEKPPFSGHDGDVLCVAFKPDGKQLISGGQDRTVRIWDVATGKDVKVLRRPPGLPVRVGFAGKGAHAVVVGENGYQSWDIESEKILRSVGTGQRGAWALSADGELVLFPQSDGFVFANKTTDSGRRDHHLYNKAWGNTVAGAFSSDGHYAAYATNGDGMIHIADLLTDKEVGKGFAGPKGEVLCLGLHVTAKVTHVLAAADDRSLTLWSLPSLPIQSRRFGGAHKEKTLCLAFSADGRHVVTGGDDAVVRVWDVSGKELNHSAEHKGPVRDVAFAPDGKSVVSCGSDGITLWEWQPKPTAKP
jgi:WD40 repeat protein